MTALKFDIDPIIAKWRAGLEKCRELQKTDYAAMMGDTAWEKAAGFHEFFIKDLEAIKAQLEPANDPA